MRVFVYCGVVWVFFIQSSEKTRTTADLLVTLELLSSKSEARIKENMIIQVGKRKFLKLQ
ncbi:hypothetical protein CPT06_05030 [Bacillus vallismortis]|nr:hypothetical protein CPT06_05030 [Bacillus vallismortis]